MKPLSESTACVCDKGLFHHIGRRLARDCKTVYYWSPWEKDFPTLRDANLGGGWEGVERIDDFWPLKDEIDFWVFPDCGFAGLQAELKSQGFAVWGANGGDEIETKRGKFLKVLDEIGLQVPAHDVVTGMENLREYLRDKEDKWIKTSLYRGDGETFHWRSWDLDEPTLTFRENQIGPCCQDMKFYVFDPISTEIEDGVDTYFVDGKFPQRVIHGFESKDKAYAATFCDFQDLPEPVLKSVEAIAPVLADYNYAGFFSAEIRIKSPDDFYFTDPTCRAASPASQVMTELIENFSEVVQAGAHGELLEPVEAAKFGMQCLVTMKREPGQWGTTMIPDEIDQWFKPISAMKTSSGIVCWSPENENSAGWLVAIGDTLEETLETLKERVAMLPDGLSSDLAPMAELLEEIKASESMGMEFTPQPIPEPGSVL